MKRTDVELKLNEIYEFVDKYIKRNGFPPSIRDICQKLSIKSTATAHSYLEKLKERGLIDVMPQKKRAITISQKQAEFKSIPLIGTVAAGSPIFAVENLEGYYPLPPEFNADDETFALRIKGDSMINAGIYDRDIIIVKKTSSAHNGQIVVALTEDSATVKRIYFRENKVILHPENDSMKDMIFDSVRILGTVQGLYRKF